MMRTDFTDPEVTAFTRFADQQIYFSRTNDAHLFCGSGGCCIYCISRIRKTPPSKVEIRNNLADPQVKKIGTPGGSAKKKKHA